MNRLWVLFLCLVGGGFSILTLGCPYIGPNYPTVYGNPTPTPPATTAVTLTGNSASNYAFDPSPVTVAQNGSITFVDTTGINHILWVDNGMGVCLSASYGVTVPANGTTAISSPFSVSPGTYHYHDINYSPCGTASCAATCTGMAGIIYIP